jgi:alkaline phosphatase
MVELAEPALVPGGPLQLIAPESPLTVGPGKSATAPVFVTGHREAFEDGRRDVRLRIGDGVGWSTVVPYRLLGPDDEEHHEERVRTGDDSKGKAAHER